MASAPLPLEVSKTGQVHVFRSFDGSEEHYAVEIGKPLPTGPWSSVGRIRSCGVWCHSVMDTLLNSLGIVDYCMNGVTQSK